MNTPLIHITGLFAESVFLKYRRLRYGLKSCTSQVDEELADDLRNLLIRKQEQEVCGGIITDSCSLTKIVERINTL
jgi:hypothetical protein